MESLLRKQCAASWRHGRWAVGGINGGGGYGSGVGEWGTTTTWWVSSANFGILVLYSDYNLHSE